MERSDSVSFPPFAAGEVCAARMAGLEANLILRCSPFEGCPAFGDPDEGSTGVEWLPVSEPPRLAPLKLAPLKLAPLTLAPLKLAPLTLAPNAIRYRTFKLSEF